MQTTNAATNTAAAAIEYVSNSIFENMQKTQLKSLQQQQQSLDTRKSSLETQLTTLNSELQAVEKQESQAISDSIPKFGL